MKKTLLYALSSMLSIGTMAQEDVTSKFIQNPSFEADDISALTKDKRNAYEVSTLNGWTLGGEFGVKDIMTEDATETDNDFGVPGKPEDGKQMLYLRHAWKDTPASVLQEVTLPAGKYRLEVCNKCVSTQAHSASLVAGDAKAPMTISPEMPAKWNVTSLDFSLDKETTLKIGLDIKFINKAGFSIILDYFKLLDVTNEKVEEEKDENDNFKDLTSLLVNPSFEAEDITKLTRDAKRGGYEIEEFTGWTLSGTYGVSEIFADGVLETDNNFGLPGAPAEGKQMYYLRHAWAEATASLLQTVTLPAGRYRLIVSNKCVSAAEQSASLVAGTESVALPVVSQMPGKWNKTYVDFTVAAEGPVTLGLVANFHNLAGISIIVDNFQLKDLGDYVAPADPTETSVESFTEGVITADFVPEAEMKADLLQMLADFSRYMVNDWNEASAPNSKDEACGFFKGENSGASDEKGVRPNADLSMICAFLVKYAKPAGVTLPNGVTWEKVEDLAMKSLVFAYSTHKANKLKVCADGKYWGSTSTSDAVWESSLWAMSVAYSAYFQWDKLSEAQKGYIYAMMKAECNYELGRKVPSGYAGDTKAEENGWEADILAATLGLFPNDDLAPKWFDRLRAFAVNSYSHSSDAADTKAIDPAYDDKSAADYYVGANLYDDFSLQNHNLFHTSYQNVVMQELGEAALALKLFQNGLHGTEKWQTNALMHNNQAVQDSILNWLALADGELAMPNGNDWSLFLYDQITSYSTQACFQKDANALMLENLAYKYIKARQKTTTDGSWLLRADVGARRMGVEAHRVMMTYLMHEALSTADVQPTVWADFNKKYGQAKLIRCQNIVRAATDYRFSCFSWSNGLKSYTGYFASNSADKNKIVVPYRANNTGNITGWYDVSGKGASAAPVVSGIYDLKGNGYVMNGEMNINSNSLNQRFAIYSTPENAIIYVDYVTAKADVTVNADKVGLLAISTDELMKEKRALYYGADDAISHKLLDGTSLTTLASNWVNVDNELGVVSNGTQVGFGDRGANNSIYTSKLYPTFTNTARSVKSGEVVDAHNIIYYSLVDAEQTKDYAGKMMELRDILPAGWNGAIAADATQAYILVSNFAGNDTATIAGLTYGDAAPVFYEPTTISNSAASVVLVAHQNNSIGQPLAVMIKGSDVVAQLIDDASAYVTALADTKIAACIGTATNDAIEIKKDETVRIFTTDGKTVSVEKTSMPTITRTDYTGYIVNPKFAGNSAYGWEGAPAVNYGSGEKFNTACDVYQIVTGLPMGKYELSCQALYRDGTYTNAATNHAAGAESLLAKLYANNKTTDIVSIFDAADAKGPVGVKTAAGVVPDNMEQASIYFNSGLYANSVICNVGEDGIMRIGVKKEKGAASDWVIFTNFKLTYIGEYEDEPEPEPENPGENAVPSIIAEKSVNGIYSLDGKRKASLLDCTPGIYVIDGKRILVR